MRWICLDDAYRRLRVCPGIRCGNHEISRLREFMGWTRERYLMWTSQFNTWMARSRYWGNGPRGWHKPWRCVCDS